MELAGNPLLEERWYHSIELGPGLWTEGIESPNICLTRELLAGVELDGCDGALDIGTQDGLVPVLLERRGADRVLAYDRQLSDGHLALVQEALGVTFDTLGGVPLSGLREALVDAGQAAFDLVVFSGVLYHMVDPFSGLACARGVLREGGLMIVETKVAATDVAAIHLDLGRHSGAGLTIPSVDGLELMMRVLGLEMLDAVSTQRQEQQAPKAGGLSDDRPRIDRLAVVCRALPLADRRPGLAQRDLLEFVDPRYVTPPGSVPGYSPASGRSPLEDARGVLRRALDRNAIPGDARVRLALGDTV